MRSSNHNLKRFSESKWLGLAVFSLALSGLYSIILALLRVPQIHKLIPYDESFRVSLIVHVDLSVIVWFLTVHIFFLSKRVSEKSKGLFDLTFYPALASIILISGSPFLAEGKPYLNNYIPILHNVFFILGLALFLSIYLVVILLGLIDLCASKRNPSDYELVFLITSSLISVASFFICYMSFRQLLDVQDLWRDDYFFFFEHLFWGGGHILQFVYIALGQVIWVYLFKRIYPKHPNKYYSLFSLVFVVNLLCVLPAIYFSIAFDVSSNFYINFYTFHMKHCGGVSTLILAMTFIFMALKHKGKGCTYSKHYFYSSIAMFFFGGALGFVIDESNTIIPAHYHGSIVGITIAIMGYIYTYIQGDSNQSCYRKACLWQIYVYFTGQTLHILGLAFSGGYGALRKLPGGEYSQEAKFFLGITGGGGLLAMIGGIMFIYISSRLLSAKRREGKFIE